MKTKIKMKESPKAGKTRLLSGASAGRKAAVLLAVLCAAAVLLLPVGVFAADYFAENDPLVTLSYLKEIFAPALKAELQAENAAESAPASDSYEVVTLTKGQKLTSSEGTVELILRPGSTAKVLSDIPDNGLSDISEAAEILDGMEVGVNHALIIPRSDGRGIEITSDTAYVLVRGNYAVTADE